MKLYMKPSHMRPDEYAAFTDPTNYTAQLLLAHAFLLDYILGDYIFRHEHPLGKVARKRVILSWISSVAEKLPPEYRPYMTWPCSYAHELLVTDPPLQSSSTPIQLNPAPSTATATLNIDSDMTMTNANG
jgi:hypothetical protein